MGIDISAVSALFRQPAPPPSQPPVMTVTAARELLRDTRRGSDAQIHEAERIVATFLAANPKMGPCIACRIWRLRARQGGRPLQTATETLKAAEAALEVAREAVANAAVDALLDPANAPKKARTVAAEAAAVEVARAAVETARFAAKAIDAKLEEATDRRRRLEEKARLAAVNVLRDEHAPKLIAEALNARREFVAASKGLRWLAGHGAAAEGADAAEIAWSWTRAPEGWVANGQPPVDFDALLAALLSDPEAR